MNISNLNDDCLLEIFKYLPALDKLKLSLVCRKWGYYLLKHLEINDSLIKEYNRIFPDKRARKRGSAALLRKTLKRCGTYLNTLTIVVNEFEDPLDSLEASEISQILLLVSKYCKNIVKISIVTGEQMCISNLDLLFKNNINLHSINLKNLDIEGKCFAELQPLKIESFEAINITFQKENALIQFVSKLKNLKIIHVRGLRNILGNQIDITPALDESNCDKISDFLIDVYQSSESSSESSKTFLNLLLKQRNLRKIGLAAGQSCSELLDKLPKANLEFLELYLTKHLTNIYQFKNLRVLHCKVHNLKDKIVNIITECKNLKELYIQAFNYSLTKVGESYFKRLQNLESIKVNYYNHQNTESTLVALSQCESLKKICVHGNFTNRLRGVGINSITSLPNLMHLEIPLSDATDKDMINFVKKSCKLEKLDIRNCVHITDKFIQEASEIKKHRNDKHYLMIIYTNFRPELMRNYTTWTPFKINIRNLKNLSPLILLKGT